MSQIFVASLMLVGCSFLLLAAVGIVRMPDLFMRMSASAKAATLGIGCMLIALMLHFRESSVTTRSILVLSFFFLLSPVAAHMIARAAYIVGVPLWEHTVCNEAEHLYPKKKERRDATAPPPEDESDATDPEMRV
ncbi:MAG TPA: monovalent cation/H(+) antiporter subunit G [Thermoanaerobaculia bacterium]|nr:monovalent cation/H(+) antiporter subunit G [Thermoanaerobaculia bacterium]